MAAHHSEREFYFSFKFPDNGFALRSVAIIDGIPQLRFSASHKVPTITEEDFAAILRLCQEDARPEFYFMAIPPFHPFFGRQYKSYHPQWMRDTSLGKLLFEADWEMKCLQIGTKSDASKFKFFPRDETSDLYGLATIFDFHPDEKISGGSVIMTCKSVTVDESDEELLFVEEPKMAITSQADAIYSKYITKVYVSVAYHAEPQFLKMREVPKMILAAEWLKKKGVKMNQEWIYTKTQPKKVTREVTISPYSALSLPASVDQFLSSIPIGLDPTGKLIIPNVKNLDELFSETVPWPQVWQFFPDSFPPMPVLTSTGGVNLKNFEVSRAPARYQQPVASSAHCKQYSRVGNTVAVSAKSDSKIKKTRKAPSHVLPHQGTVEIPPRDVGVKTDERRINEHMDMKSHRRYGSTEQDMKEISSHSELPMQWMPAVEETDHSRRSSVDSGIIDHSSKSSSSSQRENDNDSSADSCISSTASTLSPDPESVLSDTDSDVTITQ